MGRPRPILFILFNNNFNEKNVDISGIWSRIVGVQGKHVDPLTTTLTTKVPADSKVEQIW